eukprot:2109576-Rhodomonas_salina.1
MEIPGGKAMERSVERSKAKMQREACTVQKRQMKAKTRTTMEVVVKGNKDKGRKGANNLHYQCYRAENRGARTRPQ